MEAPQRWPAPQRPPSAAAEEAAAAWDQVRHAQLISDQAKLAWYYLYLDLGSGRPAVVQTTVEAIAADYGRSRQSALRALDSLYEAGLAKLRDHDKQRGVLTIALYDPAEILQTPHAGPGGPQKELQFGEEVVSGQAPGVSDEKAAASEADGAKIGERCPVPCTVPDRPLQEQNARSSIEQKQPQGAPKTFKLVNGLSGLSGTVHGTGQAEGARQRAAGGGQQAASASNVFAEAAHKLLERQPDDQATANQQAEGIGEYLRKRVGDSLRRREAMWVAWHVAEGDIRNAELEKIMSDLDAADSVQPDGSRTKIRKTRAAWFVDRARRLFRTKGLAWVTE